MFSWRNSKTSQNIKNKILLLYKFCEDIPLIYCHALRLIRVLAITLQNFTVLWAGWKKKGSDQTVQMSKQVWASEKFSKISFHLVRSLLYFYYCCFNAGSRTVVGKVESLTLNHWANSADDKLVIFSYFFLKTGFDISCKLSPIVTVCMKCQILFSGKIRKIS